MQRNEPTHLLRETWRLLSSSTVRIAAGVVRLGASLEASKRVARHNGSARLGYLVQSNRVPAGGIGPRENHALDTQPFVHRPASLMDADRARLWAVLREYNEQVCELGVCAVLLHEPCNVEPRAFAAWVADDREGWPSNVRQSERAVARHNEPSGNGSRNGAERASFRRATDQTDARAIAA